MTLVILRYGKLGDIVLSTVLIEALYREHKIFFATKKKYIFLYKDDPRISGLFYVENNRVSTYLSHIQEIKKINPDMVVDLERKIRTYIISSVINSKTVKYNSMRKERINIVKGENISIPPVWQRYLNTLDLIGIPYDLKARPKLFIHPSDIEKAKKIMKNVRSITIHTHSLHKQKELLKKNISPVVSYLKKIGFRTIHVGDRSSYSLPVDNDLRGKTDFGLLKAVLHLSDILITSDSGPLHISEAVGTPVIAIYGSTSPLLGFAPWMKNSEILKTSLPCNPCSLHGGEKCIRGDMKCLEEISSDRIIEKVRKIIEFCDISS